MIDLIWVTITARPPILQITFSLLRALARDSDAATPAHKMMISMKMRIRMIFIIPGMKMRIGMTGMKMRRGGNGNSDATQGLSVRHHRGI